MHGEGVVGTPKGGAVLPTGLALVVGPAVVVDVVLAQLPVGHCQTPLASAVHMHLPPHPLEGLSVVLAVELLEPWFVPNGRSLVQ